MTVKEICEFMDKYLKCPECGCGTIGCENVSVDINTSEFKRGSFHRSCSCGWYIKLVIND